MSNIYNDYLAYDQTGINLTEDMEGRKLVAYQDAGGIWTIGTGHTGPDVHEGLTITAEQDDALLRGDIVRAEIGVKRFVNVPLTQDEYDGCVDFAFNCGVDNFRKSTLLIKLNNGDFAGAAAQFQVWDKVGGQVSKGLLRRRIAEEELFTQGLILHPGTV